MSILHLRVTEVQRGDTYLRPACLPTHPVLDAYYSTHSEEMRFPVLGSVTSCDRSGRPIVILSTSMRDPCSIAFQGVQSECSPVIFLRETSSTVTSPSLPAFYIDLDELLTIERPTK